MIRLNSKVQMEREESGLVGCEVVAWSQAKRHRSFVSNSEVESRFYLADHEQVEIRWPRPPHVCMYVCMYVHTSALPYYI